MLKFSYLNGDILSVYIILHGYSLNTSNSLYLPVIIMQIILTNYISYFNFHYNSLY